jgi:hypothetical protein
MTRRPDRDAFNAALRRLRLAAVPLAGEMSAFLPIEAVGDGAIIWDAGAGILVSSPGGMFRRGLMLEQWERVQRLPSFAGYERAREDLRRVGERVVECEREGLTNAYHRAT